MNSLYFKAEKFDSSETKKANLEEIWNSLHLV